MAKSGKKQAKLRKLRIVADNLTALDPKLRDTFMCPTCLRLIPLANASEISEAHIAPRSGGGRLATFLCGRCNHTFGSRQDKWFGEYLYLAKKEPRSLFATRVPPKFFTVDGVRLNGIVRESDDGAIELIYYKGRNPPHADRQFDETFGQHPQKIKVEIQFPILGQERAIKIGYITAGYLTLFYILGYSWVLQSHLDRFRTQILKPDKELFNPDVPTAGRLLFNGEVGVVFADEQVMLGFGLLDRVALFPPADRPLASLSNSEGIQANFRFLRDFPSLADAPVGLILGDRMLVLPDALRRSPGSGLFLFYPPEGGPPHRLRPVNEEEADALARDPKTRRVKIDMKKPPSPGKG